MATHLTTEHAQWDGAVSRLDWRQGEHVTLIGPTGVGKTELMLRLIEGQQRQWVVFLSTKRIDPTLDRLKGMGFMTIRRGNEVNPEVASRFTVAPPWKRKASPSEQDGIHRREYEAALNRAYWQTAWTVCIDELEYINRDLKITSSVDRLLRQGRSQKNSVIVATQRPRHVTLHAYEQATHLFIWRQSDMGNIVRAAELAGVNREQVMEVVPSLGMHDVMYVNTNTGDSFVTNTRE